MSRRLRPLIALLGLAASLSFALAPEAAGQDVHPGAVPPSSVGDPNAPVSIEVFNDYQCPACAKFNEALKKLRDEYKGGVRVIFRNYPLTVIHKNARPAAEAAEAAGLQGKFVEMIDLLYDRQAQWGNDNAVGQLLNSYARQLGLDVERFARDMKSAEVAERILLDDKRALSLKLSGTPTVFVNGKDAGFTFESVRRAVEEALDPTKVNLLEPSDLIPDFPAVAWEMSFEDARRAIEKAGARPVRAREGDVSELVWTGKFRGMDGRARVHFREGGGLDDVVVGVYAFERRGEVFDAWLRRLTERHGKPNEESDNEVSTSKVWRLRNGFVIELRSLKDPNSPVVDIHWVKL